jgi:putative ABC transport system permease protein
LLRLALRSLAERRLRTLTTTLAVFLGVGLASGAYVLTDTINAAFSDIFSESLKGTDVVVTPKEIVKQEDKEPPAFSDRYLPRVRQVNGVEAAAGGIFSLARLVDRKGDPIGPQFSPNFAASLFPKRFENLKIQKGRYPRTADETSIDDQTANREHLHVGDRVGVSGERRVRFYRIVGISRLGKASFGGASIAQLILPEAQRVVDKRGKFDQISVAAAGGVSDQALRDRIRSVLPRSLTVETAKQSADRQASDIASDLSFLTVVVLVFSGVALFVAAFLIFNTFSITVAQRIREMGMLRTLGASRGQILRSVVLEAAVTGVAGSVLGLFGGIGFAAGIRALFRAIGADLPSTAAVIATRTVIVSLSVGILVTIVSVIGPALRATRVSPMAALHEAELPESRRRGRIYAALAVALVLVGVVLTCIGLFGGIESSSQAAGLMGAGAVGVVLGVSLFSPRLVRPLAAVAGAPMERFRGLTGRLARENALRKPGRTAVTAAALMIGLAIVTFVTVFAAGIKSSINQAIDRNFQGDIVMQNIDGFSPISSQLARETRRLRGVRLVSTQRISFAKVRGVRGERRVSGLDPRTANEVLKLDWKKGSPDTISRLGPHDAVIDDAWGESQGIDVGDTMRALTPTGRRTSFRVVGRVKDNADLIGDFVVTQGTLRSEFGTTEDSTDFVKVAPGANASTVQDRVTKLVEHRFPTAEALNQKELKDKQSQQISQLLGLIYALLSLAIVSSLFGIVNTLALSIHERTRELGMLRAVGMSQKQVRRMIRYESVITAMIGALLGSLLGCVFAALVSRPLADEGFTLSYPVGTLVILLILAAGAGVVAAIGPARRAANLDVLEALAYE